MSSSDSNKAQARHYIDSITRGDAVAMLDALDDSVAIYVIGSTLASGNSDKQSLGNLLKLLKGAFPHGIKMTIHNVIAEDDYVSLECESYGEHTSGKIYNNEYNYVFRFKAGKITELREYTDTEHVTDVFFAGQRPLS
jgi:ketosteroid isomerase-like protein